MAGHRDWRTEMATAEVAHLKVKSNILEKLFDEPDRERPRSKSGVRSPWFSSVQLGSLWFGSVSCHSLADPSDDDI